MRHYSGSLVSRMNRGTYTNLCAAVLSILLFASQLNAEPFRFVAMADSRGSSNGVNDPVLSGIVNLVLWEDAAFVLFPGDLVNGSSTDSILSSQLNHWRDVMAPIYNSGMYGAKVYAGPGNHELRTQGSEAVWRSLFNDLPANGPAGEEHMTYSFDYMNVHFVMLNTDRAGNPHTVNYDWLENDLAATSADHIFVFGHEPAFPAGPHLGSSLDYYPDQRDAFWQLLQSHSVDIYFAGHEHLYNHTIVNDVDQLIVGTSGAPIYRGYGGDFYHYSVITVDGSDVAVEIIDDSGALRDAFYVCRNGAVRIGRTGSEHATIQEAYDIAIDGDVLQVRFGLLDGDIHFDRSRSVSIEGGYSCDYSELKSKTVLNGTLTISDGSVSVGAGAFEIGQYQ